MKDNSLRIKAELEIEGTAEGRILSEDTKISDDLPEEFTNQTDIFAWWATMSELAKDKVLRLSTELKRKGAEIDGKLRAEWEANEDDAVLKAEKDNKKYARKKYTEKIIETRVFLHEVYKEIENELIEARKQAGLLQAGKEALTMKKEMLISIGANYRAEGMPNPTIMKKAAKQTIREVKEKKEQEQKEEIINNSNTVKRRPVRKK